MKQLIVITGSKGAGKSTAAATIAPPSESGKMFVIDTENSMSDIVDQIKFGKYVRAYERFKLDASMLGNIAKGNLPWVNDNQKTTMAQYYDWFIKTLDKELEQGKYKYLVIDTVESIEAAFAAAVESDKNRFGWSGSKAYGRLETEGVRPLYENLLEAIYARGVETIILNAHLRSVWVENTPVVNAVKPGGRLTVLTRLSTLMLWLVPNVGNDDGAPAALVLKARLGKMTPTPEGWKTQRILPQRIPHFSWIDVNNYRQHPANLANPLPDEIPTEAEQQMISEMLTNEQMKLMVMGAELQLKQMQAPAMLVNNSPIDADQLAILKDQGLQPAEIAKELGAPLPAVLAAMRNGSN